MEKNKEKRRKNIVLAIIIIILVIALLFIIWFFNRKFEITFDMNNGTKDEVVLVKYNKQIDEEDVKTKDELGEKFIGWYLVVEQKGDEEILADKPFDFTKKIKENIKLKAVYEQNSEIITITFDTKGGNKIAPITINKGEELILPKDPTLKGNKFICWVDKNETPIYNKVILNEDTTLYAKWEKVKVEKKEEPKAEVKKEEVKLTLSRDVIHYNGIKTSKASAEVINSTGEVTYSLSDTKCMVIDAKTGVITAKNNGLCSDGAEVKVYAKTPGGATAEKTIYYEKDLELTSKDKTYNKYAKIYGDSDGYSVTANQDVTWDVTFPISVSYDYTYNDFKTKTSTFVKGGYSFDTIVASTGAISKVTGDVRLYAKTKAGQSFYIDIHKYVA